MSTREGQLLREQILKSLRTHSTDYVSREFGIGVETVKRLKREKKTGEIVPMVQLTQRGASERLTNGALKALIMTEVIAGRWCLAKCREMAKSTDTRQSLLRMLAIEAAGECRAALSPHRIAFGLMDDIDRIRAIGIKAERVARDAETSEEKLAAYNSAANAYAKAGTLGAALVKGAMLANALGSGAGNEAAKNTEQEIHAELVKRGWAPPSIQELPAPTLDDPERETFDTTGESDG